jgi:hypothetical protein
MEVKKHPRKGVGFPTYSCDRLFCRYSEGSAAPLPAIIRVVRRISHTSTFFIMFPFLLREYPAEGV